MISQMGWLVQIWVGSTKWKLILLEDKNKWILRGVSKNDHTTTKIRSFGLMIVFEIHKPL